MTDTTTAEPKKGGLSRFTQFNRDFWVINGIELLERGAYYSLAPLLVPFMIDVFTANGMAEGAAAGLAGTITAVNFFLLYAVPLFAAALAEKFGYKAALTVSFGLLVGGYGFITFAGTVPALLACVTLIGFGAGIFKPIAAAMVSQTTREDQRNTAFAIYYGCINLGAFIIPTAVAVAAFFYPDLLIPIAFGAAAGLSLVNFGLVLSVFRNVNPPRTDVNVLGAFRALGAVFRQPAFLVLLVIYSGFWFMYALNLSFLAEYMLTFERMPAWFTPTLVISLNALVIILAAPLIGVLTARFESIPLITVGILGYAAGILVLGWSSTPSLFVAGIVIFSLFELVTHPSYLAYVSKIAPPDKVSIYLGYGFLPIAVGLTLGSSVGGALYGSIALEGGNPARFWALIAAVGAATVALLLLYNTLLSEVRGRAAGSAAPRRNVFARAGGAVAAVAVALLVIPGILAGAAIVPASNLAPSPIQPASADLETVKLDPVTDYTDAGASTTVPVTLPEGAEGAATLVLTWTDEAGQAGQQNLPDTFRLHVKLANGTMLMQESDTGEIVLPFDAAPGTYEVVVELVEAGGRVVSVGPFQLPAGQQQDTGNEWTLAASYQTSA